MYIYEEETKYGIIRYACADQGKKILIGEDILVDKVAMGKYSKLEDFREIDDADYVPPEEIPEETVDPLETLKKNQIKLSKNNLANYLQDNPLLSTVKYPDGRYYNVTAEKQQQLTSKVLMATMYAQIGIPYNLTWNSTTDTCEDWTLEQLQELSMQIDAYVTPLVSVQQHMEVDIKNCTTQEDVLAVDINFTEENINRYLTEVNTNE